MEWVLVAISLIIIAIIAYKKKKEKNKLPSGLQIWDENGSLVLDTTEGLTRIYGQTTVYSKDGSVTLPIPESDTNPMFVIVIQKWYWYTWGNSGGAGTYVKPGVRIWITGRTISWNRGFQDEHNASIWIGNDYSRCPLTFIYGTR